MSSESLLYSSSSHAGVQPELDKDELVPRNGRFVSPPGRKGSLTFHFTILFVSIFGVMMFLLSLMTAIGLPVPGLLGDKHSNAEDTYSNVEDTHNNAASVSQIFQTTPQIYAGHTLTGQIPLFMAQTNAAPFGTSTFIPNTPLETAVPIAGNVNNSNIYQLMGHLSSYFPNPVGFGSNEYPLPPGANLSSVHVLQRHGSRYPTSGSPLVDFGNKIYNVTNNGTARWTGALTFLNDWKYQLGAAILVARGRQELFDSGVLHYYNYGGLYKPSTKIIARTTTQDRMLKSAEYFMTGFFGLEWTQNATLEVIIEQPGFNNSLAGYYQCDNAYTHGQSGTNASRLWSEIYLANATQRFNALSGGYKWTVADLHNAQTMCPYETVAYGYSAWCQLFTYDEWEGFEYSIDLAFHGDYGAMSPVGRGVGIGYVEELHARLQNHVYDLPDGSTNVNATLDGSTDTFPLNQTLYFDFSHDSNIYSILTAFGLTQFADQLSNSSITPGRNVTISHITPFAARVAWEIIRAPRPLKVRRPATSDPDPSSFYGEGGPMTYVHLIINQRTVPLGASYASCQQRDDGWCELGVFMDILSGLLSQARYQYSCFGNFTDAPWGVVTDGTPATKRRLSDVLGRGLNKPSSSEPFLDA